MPDRENVTVRAKSADYARSDSRNERMTTEFFLLSKRNNISHFANNLLLRQDVETLLHASIAVPVKLIHALGAKSAILVTIPKSLLTR
jgi:hypothetical protein